MGIKRFIIKRHLTSEGKDFFANFTSFISIFGVSIGVAALIVVLSVTSGFQKAYRDKILSHSGQIFIRKYGGIQDYKEAIEKIKKVKGVKGATPMVYHQILISSATGDKGAQLKGIDPKTVNEVSNFNNMVSDVDILKQMDKGEKIILVGKAIADSLNLKKGDLLTITFPFNSKGKVSSYPKVVTFKIGGFVYSGMYDFDNNYTYISIQTSQKIFKTGDVVKGIEVKIDSIDNVDQIGENIRIALGKYPFVVSTFKEMYSNLFQSLEYQKIFIGLILIIIIILASFSIIGTLLIYVTEKEKDIALLKALGMRKFEIVKLFMMEGATIGIIGIIMGFIIGFLLLFGVSLFDIHLDPDIYNITYIPISIQPLEVVAIFVISLLIATISTIYPAYKAAKLSPADGIIGRSINR